MISCPICSKECESEKGLRIHLGRIHKDSKELSNRAKTLESLKVPLSTHSVPIGTIFKMTGQCFWQDPETKSFSLMDAEGLTAKVVYKEFQPMANKTFLFCSVYRSEYLWSVLEEEVLGNKFQIVTWGEPIVSEFTPTSPSVDIVLESPFNEKERAEYLALVSKYAQARDLKNDTAEEYKKVDAEARPKIIEYLKKYGVESIANKGDNKLVDGGWEVLYSNCPGKSYIERDESRIVQWLVDSGHEECLKKVLDVEAWENLKKIGEVPSELLVEVEIPKITANDRKFYVKRVV